MEEQTRNALKDLLFRLADDKLIIGHRNSEWCGMGPVLEEDIAFASMAQDEIGHSEALYRLLHELGEAEPDTLAFTRPPNLFRSCQFVEQPIGDYAFSLARHFLCDYADRVRLKHLVQADYAPLAELAKRITREEKYHSLHAKTWIIQLANGTEEGRLRLQTALNEAFPMAFGIFEPTEYSQALKDAGIQPLEDQLADEWLTAILDVLQETTLQLPTDYDPAPYLGGRKGYHSEFLAPLLDEMTVVYQIDPTATW